MQARYCIRLGISPSEFKKLTIGELNAFARELSA
jgi:hypothetical protein